MTSGYGGVNASLTATSSQFDSVQLGSGLHLEQGSSATISGSTFDNDGTGNGVTQSSNGLVVDNGATASIVDSQFVGNTNAGMVAFGSVTAQGSTFSGNRTGDGALFGGQGTVTLTGDTFASNGEVVGESTGLNGVEFLGLPGDSQNFTGTAVLSGNLFQNNTSNGIFIGSTSSSVQILNNTFENNVVGISMDSTYASVNATIQGNTIEVPVGTADVYAGVYAIGGGVTATVGGPAPRGIRSRTTPNTTSSRRPTAPARASAHRISTSSRIPTRLMAGPSLHRTRSSLPEPTGRFPLVGSRTGRSRFRPRGRCSDSLGLADNAIRRSCRNDSATAGGSSPPSPSGEGAHRADEMYR